MMTSAPTDLQGYDTLLVNLAVLRARMDAVDHIASALLRELFLQDPGVHVDADFGHCVGAAGPPAELPIPRPCVILEFRYKSI